MSKKPRAFDEYIRRMDLSALGPVPAARPTWLALVDRFRRLPVEQRTIIGAVVGYLAGLAVRLGYRALRNA